LHRRHKRSVDAHPTVPERQGLRDRGHLLVGEPVGVLLVGVDDDLQLTDAGARGWPAAFAWHTAHCAPYCITCSHYPEAPVEQFRLQGKRIMSMPENDQDLVERVHSLETAQAVQVATQTGAQATQAATQAGQAATTAAGHAGTWATMGAGGAGLIVGIFLGLSIAKS